MSERVKARDEYINPPVPGKGGNLKYSHFFLRRSFAYIIFGVFPQLPQGQGPSCSQVHGSGLESNRAIMSGRSAAW